MTNQSVTGFILSGKFPVSFSKRPLTVSASGYRLYTSGAVASVGLSGFSWSSTPGAAGSVYAGRLSFVAASLSPLDHNVRVYGFPVRCVRAFTATWKECVAVLDSAFVVRCGGQSFCLPASGYRYYSSGALTLVGSYGCAWSGSPNASGNVLAGYLDFSAANVYPMRGTYRTIGFPVRCVRAFTAAWKECAAFGVVLGSGFRCAVAVSRSAFPLRAPATTRPVP